jgi:D(-)-tartrate dehydratase
MRITGIADIVVPIASSIRNAYIDFSTMTASVVAIFTDVKRDGKPVVGFGFNSNGRYAPQGLLRERFIPRLKAAKPEEIADARGFIDPFKAWDVMMRNEKPGGHGERSVAVETVDMAVWDACAKIAEKPLYRLLAERYRKAQADERVFVYAAGGYYHPGSWIARLTREASSGESRTRLSAASRPRGDIFFPMRCRMSMSLASPYWLCSRTNCSR